MFLMISDKARRVNPSPTLAISAKAKAMQAKGIDVVSFAAGQPDFPPPSNVVEAAIASIRKGNTNYTPTSGIPELRKAIADKLKHDNGISYEPSQVVVSCGAKHSLYNAFQAILNPGDEVIIPSPFWVSYPEFATMADAKPVFAETGDDFKATAALIEKCITPKTKIIVLNSPSNPTGAVIERSELKKIAELAVQHGIYVISDEIYEKIIYGKEHVSIASFNDEIKALTLTVNGMSKAFSIPGWRLGYLAGPQDVVDAIGRIQDNSTSNPASVVQDAALAALTGPQDFMKAHVEEYMRRRDFIVSELRSIAGVKCNVPDGAFYVFPDFGRPSEQLCNELLEKANVACIPGKPFGRDTFVRFSYATSMDNIKKGMERVKKFMAQ